MSNRALWQVLNGFKIKHDDFSICEFCEQIEAEMGEGYEVEVWDHDDYDLGDIPQVVVEWLSDHTKGKTVEDLQVQLYETDDPGDEAFLTVVALKVK